MTFEEYQELALRTKSGPPTTLEAVLGLSGEAGECADIVKKSLFQEHDFDKGAYIEELGDVLWYLSLAAEALKIGLSAIAEKNIDKLRKRYPDGFCRERSVHREGENE